MSKPESQTANERAAKDFYENRFYRPWVSAGKTERAAALDVVAMAAYLGIEPPYWTREALSKIKGHLS
jgi:hypothetical protein